MCPAIIEHRETAEHFKVKRTQCNQIPHPTLKAAKERSTHTTCLTFTKDTHSQLNEQFFPKHIVIILP